MLKSLRLFIQLSRPLFIIGGALVYALGAGIARYLGVQINWVVYLVGQFYVSALQLSAHYLNEYFDAPADQHNQGRTPFSGGSGAVGEGKISRSTLLLIAFSSLTVVASLTVILISIVPPTPMLVLIIVLAVFGAIFYSTPPLRLVRSGYGELTTSILVANIVPLFAFYLQTGDIHRLLPMSTFPLTALHLAMMLSFSFPDYAVDVKFDKKNLLVRMGWERTMILHNFLVIGAFLLLILAIYFDLPLAIGFPAFLPFPLGLLQIWQMIRIAAGARPDWRALGLTAVALFASVTYMLTFAYWTH